MEVLVYSWAFQLGELYGIVNVGHGAQSVHFGMQRDNVEGQFLCSTVILFGEKNLAHRNQVVQLSVKGYVVYFRHLGNLSLFVAAKVVKKSEFFVGVTNFFVALLGRVRGSYGSRSWDLWVEFLTNTNGVRRRYRIIAKSLHPTPNT